MNKNRLAALAPLLFLAACGTAVSVSTETLPPPSSAATTTLPAPSTTEPAAAEETCSTSGLRAQLVPQELPDPVAQTRFDVFMAAASCDYDTLAGLTAAEFTYSFGGDADPAGYWREREQLVVTTGHSGPPPLHMMMLVLNLPHATIEAEATTYHVRPAAFAYPSWDDVPDSERQALLDIYGAADLQTFSEFGSYVGYRIGITAAGERVYFVAGD